jgi:hypothetical protein
MQPLTEFNRCDGCDGLMRAGRLDNMQALSAGVDTTATALLAATSCRPAARLSQAALSSLTPKELFSNIPEMKKTLNPTP